MNSSNTNRRLANYVSRDSVQRRLARYTTEYRIHVEQATVRARMVQWVARKRNRKNKK